MELLIVLSVFMYVFTAVTLIPFVAEQKQRSAFGWAVIAIVWTPVLALIALAAVPIKVADED